MVGSLGQHINNDNNQAAFLIGDHISRNDEDHVRLSGGAEVRQSNSVIKGDEINYDQVTGEVDVRGNGLLMRDGSIVRGPHLRFNVNDDTGEIQEPKFWLGGSAGRGHADRAEILDKNHMRLHGVQYSGFDGDNPAWYIRSSQVDTYDDENEGVARHGVLYFQDTPILYAPYLTFPLRNERKSGFLLPTYGTSSNSGIELTTPYYLNLAPNYDATLYPRFMSKRGLLLGTEFRHLSRTSESTLFGTYNMRDRMTGDKRWLYSVQHEQNLGYGFRAYVDARRVSDDDYFRDHASFGLADAAITYMPSQARLYWSGYRYFSASLRVHKYQTLQDSTGSFLAPPYDRLPELTFSAKRYGWNGFDVTWDNNITRFVAPMYRGSDFTEYRNRRLKPNGTRMTSYAAISRPFTTSWGYIKPKFGIHATQYETEWFGNNIRDKDGNYAFRNRPTSQTRILPISSVDAGITLERDASLFGKPSIQTLEPRLYYLYVPYRNQTELPVYDTGMASFSYQQIFDENIFSGGWDRIANANQLTVGLTTRWLDADTGFERLSLSAAQRYYFNDQEVTLPSQGRRTDTESDYLFGASAALTDKFSVYFDGQFDSQSFKRNRLSTGVRWSPKRLATVSLSYRYERDPNIYTDPYNIQDKETVLQSRENISLTAQWPFSQRWYGVGRFDYSIAEKRNTQSILGVEYRGDGGWAARVVMQRYAVSSKKANTALFMQLELTGLGSLGNDPMSLLSDRITGYQSVTTPIPEKTIFERYE